MKIFLEFKVLFGLSDDVEAVETPVKVMMLHSKFNSGELRKKNCVIGIVVKTTIYLEKNKMI